MSDDIVALLQRAKERVAQGWCQDSFSDGIMPLTKRRRQGDSLRWAAAQGRLPVTVCIAAIFAWPGGVGVIGAADRMLTVWDETEYEPPQAKIYSLAPNAAILISGSTSAQIVIGRRTDQEIKDRGIVSIHDMAAIYARHFAEHRRAMAEATLLSPLGLTLESFMHGHGDMSAAVVDDLINKLQDSRLSGSAIIAGVDSTGAHLFTIYDPGLAACNDREGFSAIGIGAPHALSQFMFQKYVPNWQLPEALLLLYTAKKHAEVAPGVGEKTDLVVIDGPNGVRRIEEGGPLYAHLRAVYERGQKASDEALSQSRVEMSDAIRRLLANVRDPKLDPGST